MNATERAAEIGTRDGRKAAEDYERSGYDCAREDWWPVPDLSVTIDGWALHRLTTIRDAYSAAFTEAVEATIREAVR